MKLIFAFIMLFTPTLAYAHSGHDHAQWWKEPIHLLPVLYLLALVMTACAISLVTKKKKERR